MRVFLDGIDGDSTISHGWSYLTELAYTGQWYTLAKLVTAAAKNHHISRKTILQKQMLQPLFVDPVSCLWQRLCHLANHHQLDTPLVNTTLARQLGLADYLYTMTNQHMGQIGPRKQHWLTLSAPLYPNVMEITDKVAARFSLEGRYPFFDRRLMEFCLALPSSQKFYQGWSRSILRFSMTDVLPSQVQWRPGKGRLGANFLRRFLDLEKDTLETMMLNVQSIQPYVNSKTLQSAYDGYVLGHSSNGEDAMLLLSAATLSKWLSRQGDIAVA